MQQPMFCVLFDSDLNNNQISWSLEAGGGVFGGLASLTSLRLESNGLQSLSEEALLGLEQLQLLALRGNNISGVHERAFSQLPRLARL